jgi:hypothetical protein
MFRQLRRRLGRARLRVAQREAGVTEILVCGAHTAQRKELKLRMSKNVVADLLSWANRRNRARQPRNPAAPQALGIRNLDATQLWDYIEYRNAAGPSNTATMCKCVYALDGKSRPGVQVPILDQYMFFSFSVSIYHSIARQCLSAWTD